MRLSNTQAVSRPQPVDRNQVNKLFTYAANAVAPHANTVRIAYTVPAGKKCYIETIDAVYAHDTAPAPAGTEQVLVQINAASFAQRFSNEVATWNIRSITLTSVGYILAGDIVQIFTGNASTGGTSIYGIGFLGAEFDS